MLRSQTETDKKWHALFDEDKEHQRIMEFQQALASEPVATDPEKWSKRLEAQLKIEDLIIKSREAQYAKITPFNAIIAALVSAVISVIVSLLAARRVARDPPNR
jgi:hypothetical protein